MEVHMIEKSVSSPIFWIIDSQMAVRLSALSAGRLLPTGRFLALTAVGS
jgi:hypothetical protein